MKNEFEKVEHNRVNGLQFLINDMTYRQPHLHFDTEILYVIEGKGTINTQQAEYSLHAGQFMIFNSCQLHEFKSESVMRILIMQLPLTNFALAYPALDSIVFDSRPVDLPEHSELRAHLFAAAESYFEEGEHLSLVTTGLAYLILYDLLRLVRFDQLNSSQLNKLLDLQKRIQRISSTIQTNYMESISLQELADEEGFSMTYFSHFFKNNFGISFQEYLNNIRCERGRYLLLNSSENLLNITNLCGFSDVRTFNKAFAKRYGNSPKNFRKERMAESERVLEQELDAGSSPADHQRIFKASESLLLMKELLNAL